MLQSRPDRDDMGIRLGLHEAGKAVAGAAAKAVAVLRMLLVEHDADRQWKRTMSGGHDVQCRGIAVLDDTEQYAAFSVGAHDILLHRRAVADIADIPDEHSGAVSDLDGYVVEVPGSAFCRSAAGGLVVA